MFVVTKIMSTFAHMKYILLIFLLMIGLPVMAAEKVVWVAAGDLQDLFDEYELQYVNELTLKGTINGSDIKVLQNWASEYRSLNLADCRIVAGGEPYYDKYTTEDDVIGSYMFTNTEFKKFVLPKTLKKIGDYALSFCGESIDFPATLTWLGDHAFTHNLFSSLHIPATLEHIGNGALNGNISLCDVTIDEDHPNYVLEDGYLYTRDHSRLLAYFAPISSRAETFTIAPETKFIDDKAFNFHRTYNITLNDRLERIGDEAFCYALNNIAPHQKKLVIPNSVTYIGESAFASCYIDQVIISDNVEHLSNYCFSECFIDDIHLPARLKHIGYAALNNNTLRNLELPDSLETIEGRAFHGLTKKRLVIPESVRRIDPEAFYYIYVDTLDIRPLLDSIPRAAFYSSQSLVKLILPPTIKRIGRSAFYECYRLKDCQLPEGLEEIEAWALAGADNMKEWHIPASVRKIDWAAFSVPNFSSHTVYMYSAEPPAETHLEAFADWTMEKSVLYVPEGSLEVYRQTAPWSYFGTIKEFDPTNIKTLRDLNESDSARCYDLQGRIVSPESHGVRIMLTRNGVQKVVK